MRKGKSVVSIRFIIKEKSPHVINKEDAELFAGTEKAEIEEDENQILLDGVVDTQYVDVDDPNDFLALCAAALPRDFTREQVHLLRTLALDHKPFTVSSLEESELWLHDYLFQKTQLMQATPNVASPFAWLRRAVMEDWK